MRTAEAIRETLANLPRDEYLNSVDVAEILGVEVMTVSRYIKLGWIHPTGIRLPNGRHNINVKDVERFITEHENDDAPAAS